MLSVIEMGAMWPPFQCELILEFLPHPQAHDSLAYSSASAARPVHPSMIKHRPTTVMVKKRRMKASSFSIVRRHLEKHFSNGRVLSEILCFGSVHFEF